MLSIDETVEHYPLAISLELCPTEIRIVSLDGAQVLKKKTLLHQECLFVPPRCFGSAAFCTVYSNGGSAAQGAAAQQGALLSV